MQSKKPSERKAVKKAYEEAINHRCKVTGKDSDCSYGTLKNLADWTFSILVLSKFPNIEFFCKTSRLVDTYLLMNV